MKYSMLVKLLEMEEMEVCTMVRSFVKLKDDYKIITWQFNKATILSIVGAMHKQAIFDGCIDDDISFDVAVSGTLIVLLFNNHTVH